MSFFTADNMEEVERRCETFGGVWESICECGANTFNMRGFYYDPSTESPTRYRHSNCGKNIIVNKWYDAKQLGFYDPEELLP